MSEAFTKFNQWFTTNIEPKFISSEKVLKFESIRSSLEFGVVDVFNVSIVAFTRNKESFNSYNTDACIIPNIENLRLWTNWLEEFITKKNITKIVGLETAYAFPRFFQFFDIPSTITNISIDVSNFQNGKTLDFPDFNYTNITELTTNVISAKKITDSLFPNLKKLTIYLLCDNIDDDLMKKLDSSYIQELAFTHIPRDVEVIYDSYIWFLHMGVECGRFKSMILFRKFDYLKAV